LEYHGDVYEALKVSSIYVAAIGGDEVAGTGAQGKKSRGWWPRQEFQL